MTPTLLARILERAPGSPRIHCYAMFAIMGWCTLTVLSHPAVFPMGKHEWACLVVLMLGVITIYCVRYAHDLRDKAVRGALAQGFSVASIWASGRTLYYITLYDADKVGQLDVWGACIFMGVALWMIVGWFRHDWRAVRSLVNWHTAPRPPLKVVRR